MLSGEISLNLTLVKALIFIQGHRVSDNPELLDSLSCLSISPCTVCCAVETFGFVEAPSSSVLLDTCSWETNSLVISRRKRKKKQPPLHPEMLACN